VVLDGVVDDVSVAALADAVVSQRFVPDCKVRIDLFFKLTCNLTGTFGTF